MLPAINRSVGMNIGFPDVCLTPAGPAPVPVPYVNIGMHAMAVGFSPNVYLSGTPALHLGSVIPITMGDEGGVAHPMIKGPGKFVMGNPIVHVNLLPGINLTSPTTGNNMNNGLGAVLAPGLTTVYYTLRTADAVEPPPADSPSSSSALALPAEVLALGSEVSSASREGGPKVESRLAAPGVGLVTIRVFSADVPARVHCALRAFSQEGVELLVIDLRGNPGGELGAFVELAGDFLPDGAEICTVVDAAGDETAHHATGEMACTLPLVILVDRATASAAELFAGCLSAHGRALVLGGPTFGKHTGYRFAAGLSGETVRVTDIHVRLPAARAPE